MRDELVRILDGNTFVVSDERGDIEASRTDPTGLFSFDTRFLSRWVLTVDGQRLNALSVDDLQYFESRFFLVPGTGTVYVDAKLSVIRQRSVGAGFRENLTVLNHDNEAATLALRMDAACDFADLFEVKDALRKKGKLSTNVERSSLTLLYVRDTFTRATVISTSEPAQIDSGGFTFAITVAPHGHWSVDIDVQAGMPYGETGAAVGQATRRSRPTCSATSIAGSTRPPRSSAIPTICNARTTAASSIWPRCGSRRSRPPTAACPPQACRGS